MIARYSFLAGAIFALSGCFGTVYRDVDQPIAAVNQFEPEKYLGLWQEIARFPVVFEKGCFQVTAEYQKIDTDTVSVKNICRNSDGSVKSDIEGKADIVGTGKLKVSFASVPFVRANYWVLGVRPDYSVAVVGAPNGKSGWILARKRGVLDADLSWAKSVLSKNGYDTSLLRVEN